MKTYLFKILAGGSILLALSCDNSNTEREADKRYSDSVKQAEKQYSMDTAEQMAFRRNEEELIKENNEKIAELKAKVKDEKNAINEKYDEQLDTLYDQNSRMKQRLDGYKKQTKSDWATFKYDFNKDMDSIGKSISRFAEKNMHKIKGHSK